MSDRAWRLNLVLMGWTVLLIAAAWVARGFLPNPVSVGRYRIEPVDGVPLLVDTATGEVHFMRHTNDNGAVFLPIPRASSMAAPEPHRGGIIDDIGILSTPTPHAGPAQ
jgi:hypothetical protein